MNNKSVIQKRVRRKTSDEHYIDNNKFFDEMCKYLEELTLAKNNEVELDKLPKIPKYIGEAMYLIASRLALSSSFSGYSFIEEMIGDALENCFLYLDKFKPYPTKVSRITGKLERGNPLAYFTRTCHFAFIRRIHKEEKHNYIKNKILINAATMNELVDMAPDDNSHFTASFGEMGIDRSGDVIYKFEERMRKNKEKEIEKRKIKEEIFEDE